MHELALMAATEWAKAQAPTSCDSIEFGRRVAQVYSLVGDEIRKLSAFMSQPPGDEDLEPPLPATPRPKTPPRFPASGAQVRPCTDAPSALNLLDTGMTLADLLRSGVMRKPSAAPTSATPEQRANAMELAGILSRHVRSGSTIEGARLLAERFAEADEHETAAGLLLRADLISHDASVESWSDLIKLADAVSAWLRTGETPADLLALQRTFPSAAAVL